MRLSIVMVKTVYSLRVLWKSFGWASSPSEDGAAKRVKARPNSKKGAPLLRDYLTRAFDGPSRERNWPQAITTRPRSLATLQQGKGEHRQDGELCERQALVGTAG